MVARCCVVSRHPRCSCRCPFVSGLAVCVRERPLQLPAAAVGLCFQRLVSLSFPVLVLEQPEYARWGWLPLAAPPAAASPAAASSSAPAASPAKPGGSGTAQRGRQRRGRSVQCSCSSGSKQLGGDPGAGHAALPAHGGKADPGGSVPLGLSGRVRQQRCSGVTWARNAELETGRIC